MTTSRSGNWAGAAPHALTDLRTNPSFSSPPSLALHTVTRSCHSTRPHANEDTSVFVTEQYNDPARRKWEATGQTPLPPQVADLLDDPNNSNTATAGVESYTIITMPPAARILVLSVPRQTAWAAQLHEHGHLWQLSGKVSIGQSWYQLSLFSGHRKDTTPPCTLTVVSKAVKLRLSLCSPRPRDGQALGFLLHFPDCAWQDYLDHRRQGRPSISFWKPKAKPTPLNVAHHWGSLTKCRHFWEEEPKTSSGQLLPHSSRKWSCLSISPTHLLEWKMPIFPPSQNLREWTRMNMVLRRPQLDTPDVPPFKDEGAESTHYADLWLLNDLKQMTLTDLYRIQALLRVPPLLNALNLQRVLNPKHPNQNLEPPPLPSFCRQWV